MEGGVYMRFSPSSEDHVATIGRSDHQLKVSHVRSNQPLLSATLQVNIFSSKMKSRFLFFIHIFTLSLAIQVSGGLSWHYRLPLVCAGSDRKLIIFKVLTK